MTIDIDAILDRANAATPGPWGYDPYNTGRSFSGGIGVIGAHVHVETKSVEDWTQAQDNANFIANARQDVPALCEYARAADARAERAEAALEQARALLKRIEWQDATTRPIYCDIVVCVACGRDHPNHKPGCDLAALMAAAPGGAA